MLVARHLSNDHPRPPLRLTSAHIQIKFAPAKSNPTMDSQVCKKRKLDAESLKVSLSPSLSSYLIRARSRECGGGRSRRRAHVARISSLM